MPRKKHIRFFSNKDILGSAPGTLVSPTKSSQPNVSIIAYDAENIIEKDINDLTELESLSQQNNILWVNVNGLGDSETISQIGKFFNLNDLALEDVLNIHHRPKAEEYEDSIFMVMRMATIQDGNLNIEQVSLFLGDNFVITFQERPGDCFNPVRERLHKGGKRIRFMKADYLAYALIDAIIDNYFPTLEHFSEELNALEDTVLSNPSKEIVEQTHDMKRELQILRHGIWPLREALNQLSNGELDLIHNETRVFFRDCYDHVIQVVDILETYRERASSLTDLYLSSQSNKMNEVMKVLTIIATIFIPLSFIAGVYGMNFDTEKSPFNMPELHWYFGYPFALGLMALFAIGLCFYFWRKGWLGKNG